MTRCSALAVSLFALGACRSSNGVSGPTVIVSAVSGSGMVGIDGLTVLSHRSDGSIIDDQDTDGDGSAQVETETDSLISVFFTPAPSPDGDDTTTPIEIVTTLAPATGTLTIHGPQVPQPVLIAGGLMVAPQTPLFADVYDIDLGCAIVEVTSLPASVDVAGQCLGTDPNIDVLVRAYTIAGGVRTLVGYLAGRVLLDDAIAMFTPPTWSTDATMVPIAVDPALTTPPALDWTLWVDTIAFDPGVALTTAGTLWDGLLVDRVAFDATITDSGSGSAAGAGIAQSMTQFIPSPPTMLAVGPTDFMDPISGPLAVDTREPFAIHWDAVPPGPSIVVDARLAWTAASPTVWDVVLPADAGEIAFPQLDSGLASVIGTPGDDPTDAPISTVLRYLDTTDFDDFPDAQAAGIFAISTTVPSAIVPDPTMGEVRVSSATATQ